MKPAKIGAALLSSSHTTWQQNNASQIPLPLRRGSNRGGEEDENPQEKRSSGSSRRSHSVKSTLLSSSSFCCTSGRKERDDHKTVAIRPAKKKGGQTHLEKELPDANRKKTKSSNETPEKPGDETGNNDEKTKRSCHVSPAHVKESKYTEVIRTLHKVPTHYTQNNLTSANFESNKLYAKVGNVKTERELPTSKVEGSLIRDDDDEPPSELQRNVMKATDDLDCPCCTSSNEADTDKSQINNTAINNHEIQRRSLDKEPEFFLPIIHKEMLQSNASQLLERDMQKELEELKTELSRERYLRKDAERKLLCLAEGCRSKDEPPFLDAFREDYLDLTAVGTCYQNLALNIETYIKKLEDSNTVLVDKLSKLHDLSPRSQEQEIQFLYAKLNQLETDKQQQKADHDACLDQVANKLVNTLLAQKNAESECKTLQARLEQMRQENTMLASSIKTVIEVKHDEDEEISCVPSATDPRKIERTCVSDVQSKKSLDTAVIQEKSELKQKAFSEKQNCITSRIPSRNMLKMPGKKMHMDKNCDEVQKRVKISNNFSIPKKNILKLDRIAPTPSYSEVKIQRSTCDSIRITPSEPKDMSNIKRRNHLQFSRGRNSCERNVSPIFEKVMCKSGFQHGTPYAHSRPNILQMDTSFTNLPNEEESSRNSSFHDADHLSNLLCDKTNNLKDLSFFGSDCNDEAEPISVQGNNTPIESSEPHRTRDEGYSTMSSDQQQDSTTDATASEQEESLLTYVPPNSYSKFLTDDSVIEGSMTSSSDSGFGPLQQMILPKCAPRESSNFCGDTGGNSSETNKSTIVRKYTCKQSQSVISELPVVHYLNNHVDNDESKEHNEQPQSAIGPSSESLCSETVQENENSCCVQINNCHPTVCVNNILSFSEKASSSKETSTSPDMQLPSMRLPVETAEKATLTEPEETLWREKTLAHFIDESIWSLYSSESDTQLRFISAEVVKELSPLPLPELDSNPKSVSNLLSDETSSTSESLCNSPSMVPHSPKVSWEEVAEELNLLDNVQRFLPKLSPFERAASDSGLYLKDAMERLEEGMKPGLKTCKNFARNIPLVRRFSDPDIEGGQRNSIETEDNIFRELPSQKTETIQANFISPASACRSHSWSVCSSSNSCQASCDEMEDLDADFLPSSKDSQDPNLSSSDVEYENLDHTEFVERWIEKEIPREALAVPEVLPKRTSCTANEDTFFSYLKNRTEKSVSSPKKFNSSDQTTPSSTCGKTSSRRCEGPFNGNTSSSPNRRYPIIFTCENINDDNDEGASSADIRLDLQLLDSEVKDFNDDFYHLCDIGSTLSIDHTVPASAHNSPFRHCEHLKNESTSLQFNESKRMENLPDVPNTVSLENAPNGKPEIFIKPLRPATLSFFGVPDRINFHRFKKREFDSNFLSPIPDKAAKVSEKLTSNKSNTRKNFKSPVNMRQYQRDEAESIPTKAQTRSKSNSCRTRKGLPITNTSVKSHGSESIHRESRRHKRALKSNSIQLHEPLKSRHLSEGAEVRGKAETGDHFNTKEGCGTSWIHVHANASHTDPKVLARLLGSMESSSESGSDNEDRPFVQSNLHLYNLCKEKRKRLKASRVDRVLSLSPKHRQSVLNRNSLYFRFSEREKEAMAHFDFLEEIPTSSSEPGSLETFSKASSPVNSVQHTKENFPPTEYRPTFWQKTSVPYSMSSSTLNSQDVEAFDHVSFSDSCAESYTSNIGSSEDLRI